ncbi:MAG: DNA utilization protein HofO [Kluyvera sp.]
MRLPERLWPLSTAIKIRSVALIAALIGILCCYQLSYREYLHAAHSREQWRTLNTRTAAIWRRLRLFVPEPVPDIAPLPFSPALFQRAGAKLVSWLPSAKGGDMVLDTPWRQVAPTFVMLAERDMQVAAFSLAAENGVLRFSLQLVRDDQS